MNKLKALSLVLAALTGLLPIYAQSSESARSSVSYTRVAVNKDGNTYFAVGEHKFELKDYAPPAGPIGVAAMQAANSLVFTTLAGKWDGDWHPAPRRQFVFVLAGIVEIEVSDGETRQLSSGDILFLEDTWGPGHDTRVVSEEAALFAIVAVPEPAKK